MSSQLDAIFIREEKYILHSKFSIVLVSFIFTPLFGCVLYCENLRKTNQMHKYASTLIGIMLLNFLTAAPFLGFPLRLEFNPLLLIHKVVISILLIYPLWKRNFINIQYTTKFPFLELFVFTLAYFVAYLNNYCINSEDCNYHYQHFSFIYFSTYAQFFFLKHILIARLVYIFILKSLIKRFKKT